MLGRGGFNVRVAQLWSLTEIVEQLDHKLYGMPTNHPRALTIYASTTARLKHAIDALLLPLVLQDDHKHVSMYLRRMTTHDSPLSVLHVELVDDGIQR